MDREHRILAQAAELFQRFGYDKTTVSDIAKAAKISKGAIYLHFKSKDELFEALLMQKMEEYTLCWLDLIDADPQGGTIAGMYKNTLYAMQKNPFISAMVSQDNHLLGSFLHKPDTILRNRSHQGLRQELIQELQQVGAVRQDVAPKVVAHIMNILSYGLVGLEGVFAAEQLPGTSELIEGIADFMDRALTPEDGGNSEAGKQVLRSLVERARQVFEKGEKA